MMDNRRGWVEVRQPVPGSLFGRLLRAYFHAEDGRVLFWRDDRGRFVTVPDRLKAATHVRWSHRVS